MSVRALGTVHTRNYFWDTSLLEWVAGEQPILEAGSVTIPGTVAATQSGAWSIVSTGVGALTVASGQVTDQGNNTLVTPTGGMALRVYYVAYNPTLATTAFFRFAAAGTGWLRTTVPASSVIAKDFGDLRYVQGGADEALILNLSSAAPTNWNAFYVEV